MDDHANRGELPRPAPAQVTHDVDSLFCSGDRARYGPYSRTDDGAELLPGRLYRFRMVGPSRDPVTLELFRDLKGIGGQLWEQEVRVLLRISAIGHPALPRILDGGYDEEDNLAFVIAERAEHDLEAENAMNAFRQRKADCVRHLGLLADALSLLHGQGLMHRNLWTRSVEVVLMGDDLSTAQLRLARFEMSTLLNNFLRRVQTSEMDGEREIRQMFITQGPRALAYYPPERLASLLGQPSVDTMETDRSDVYGLGVLAWEWFVGPLPEDLLAQGARALTLSWARNMHAALMDGITRAKLPARLNDLLRGMLTLNHRDRLTSSAVVGEMSRHYDSWLASYEPAVAGQPYLVAFMPKESRPTVHSWGWIARDPETDEGRLELAEFLQAELRGARVVYSPKGADLPYVSGEDRSAMRQAQYALLGRRGVWFCNLFQYRRPFGGRPEVMEDIILIRWVARRDRASALAATAFQRRISDVTAIPWTLGRTDLDWYRRDRPSWRPLLEAVRVSVPTSPWQATVQRALDWFLDQQTVQLRAREYPFTIEPGMGTSMRAFLRYDHPRDQTRIHKHHPTALFSQFVGKKGRRPSFGDFFGTPQEEDERIKVEFRRDEEGRPGSRVGGGVVERRLDDDLIEVRVYEGTLPALGWVRPDGDYGTETTLKRQREAAVEFLESKALLAHLMAPATIRGPRDRWPDVGRGLRGGADVVVKDILASQAFYALHGPPGTGKTTVASHVVEAFLRAERGARLLISAQSNFALDNLALRILSRLARRGRDILAVRVTSPLAEERDKIDEGMEPWKLEKLVESRVARIASESGARLGRRDDPEPVRAILGRWRAALTTSYLELQERIHRGANLVFATCLTATKRNVDAVGNFGIYDWVIVEEAAKAWPTELAIPLVRGVRWALIGDHLQLSAHKRREVEEFLDECATSADEVLRMHGEARADYARVFGLFGSLFQQVVPAGPPGPGRGLTPPLGQLTTQFRMRRPIAEVISRAFYDFGLETDDSTEVDSGLTAPAALAGRALVWLDTEGVSDCSATPRWSNPGEARIVAALLRQMRPAPLTLKVPQDDEGDKPLAILTPYRQQKQLLKIQPMPAGCAECVHSVNEYQGHEANVVIASLVRDNTKGATPQQNFGFLVEPELVNVMLSRARRLLVVVGRFRHFHESGIGFWRVVCETVLQEGRVLPAAEVVLADAEDA